MENKLYDVTALGELLIDFTENGNSSQGNPTFEANPGGAPCNVLVMLNRLGKIFFFIGTALAKKQHLSEKLETICSANS